MIQGSSGLSEGHYYCFHTLSPQSGGEIYMEWIVDMSGYMLRGIRVDSSHFVDAAGIVMATAVTAALKEANEAEVTVTSEVGSKLLEYLF